MVVVMSPIKASATGIMLLFRALRQYIEVVSISVPESVNPTELCFCPSLPVFVFSGPALTF